MKLSSLLCSLLVAVTLPAFCMGDDMTCPPGYTPIVFYFDFVVTVVLTIHKRCSDEQIEDYITRIQNDALQEIYEALLGDDYKDWLPHVEVDACLTPSNGEVPSNGRALRLSYTRFTFRGTGSCRMCAPDNRDFRRKLETMADDLASGYESGKAFDDDDGNDDDNRDNDDNTDDYLDHIDDDDDYEEYAKQFEHHEASTSRERKLGKKESTPPPTSTSSKPPTKAPTPAPTSSSSGSSSKPPAPVPTKPPTPAPTSSSTSAQAKSVSASVPTKSPTKPPAEQLTDALTNSLYEALIQLMYEFMALDMEMIIGNWLKNSCGAVTHISVKVIKKAENDFQQC